MPLNIRTYHDLTEPDRSGLAEQIGAQRRRVAERLAGVARVVAVMSGKGGVGKSFVTAQLARALTRMGRAAGVLDADLNGPTAPRLLRLPVASCTLHDGVVEPAVSPEGVRCFSMGLLLEDGRPLAFRGPAAESFVWRGALEATALRELLPAPPAVLTVTIPTPESRDAVRRAMHAARAGGSELVGILENMVGGEFV